MYANPKPTLRRPVYLLTTCLLSSALLVRVAHAQENSAADSEAAPAEVPQEAATPEAPPTADPAPPPPETPPEPEAPAEVAPDEAPAETASEPVTEDIQITVVGTALAKTAGSAHVVSERQLERFEHDDPHAILLQVPGVYVRQEDGMGLRPNIGLRGVDPERSKKVTLMEDGILFGPSPYAAPAAYFFPMMTRMSEVRVIKGPGSISFGPQTVGGAIDLVSRAIPTQSAGGADVGLGDFGYGKGHFHFGDSNGRFGFLVEGVHLRNSGFMQLPGGGDTGAVRNEWVVKAAYKLEPSARVRQELGLKLMYSDEGSNQSYLGLTDADFRENPYRRYAASALDRMEFHRTSFVASHLLEVPEWDLTIKTQVYRQDLSRNWNKFNRFAGVHPFEVLRDPATYGEQLGLLRGDLEGGGGAQALLIGPNDRKHFSQGVQSILSTRATSGPVTHRLEAGVRLHRDGVARRHTEDGYLMVDGQLFHDGNATSLLQLNTATANALALHVADAMTWQRLTLTPGARVELIQLNANNLQSGDAHSRNVHAVLPGMSAFYGLTNTLGVLAGVHRGFSPPTPQVPNPGEALPESESSVNYETGVRYTSRRARAEVIGFFNDYSNITGTCSQARGCITDNVDRQFDGGRAHIYGFEAYATHEVPVGSVRLPFSAAYTFTRSAFQTSFDSDNPIWGGVSKGDSIPYIPEHQLNTTLGVESARAGGMVGVTYVAPMREQAGGGPLAQALATDEQLWVDLEGHVQVLGNLMLYANVRNLFNAQNIVARRPFGARVNPPRWVQAGVKVAF